MPQKIKKATVKIGVLFAHIQQLLVIFLYFFISVHGIDKSVLHIFKS